MTEFNKTKNFLLVFIVFLTSFSLWFFVKWNVDVFLEKGNTSITDNNIIKEVFLDKDLNLDLFWQVHNLVKSNFYSSSDLKDKDLEYWFIKWYVSSLWDKFSEFMTPKETKEFEDSLNWDFEWIWAVIEENELWVKVDMVIKWSPALANDVRKWDIIIEANWISLWWLSSTEAVSHIKWQAWTKVKLKILRDWESDFIYKEITRDKVKVPSVDSKFFEEDKIWYISVNIFWENTSKEFLEALNSFDNDKTDWIVIDLRNNWWWYLQSAVEILSNFVENWKLLVTTKYKNSVLNNYYYSENTWKIFSKKIVILINWNTASASEITAWALRDYNKAILVWEKSYWKWSVQEPFNLPDWSLLKLTIAKWYTPKDYSIDKNWINPDVEVNFQKEDYTPISWKEKDFEPYDRQLEEAKKVLKDYVKFDNIWLVVSEYEKSHPKTWTWEVISGSWVINNSSWKTN